MSFVKSHRVATTLIAALIALALGGIAYATIPDSGGVIHGCFDVKTGALRVIDTDKGQTCAAGKETALPWNQTGPQGPIGPQGPAGTAKAWARIDFNGNIVASHGLGSATATHPSTGVYCMQNLPFQPSVAVATAPAGLRSGPNGPEPGDFDVNVVAGTFDPAANPGSHLAFCDNADPGTSQVRIYVANSNGLFDRGFSIFLDG